MGSFGSRPVRSRAWDSGFDGSTCDLGVLHVVNGSVSPAVRTYFLFPHKDHIGRLKGLAKPGDSLADSVLASVRFLSV